MGNYISRSAQVSQPVSITRPIDSNPTKAAPSGIASTPSTLKAHPDSKPSTFLSRMANLVNSFCGWVKSIWNLLFGQQEAISKGNSEKKTELENKGTQDQSIFPDQSNWDNVQTQAEVENNRAQENQLPGNVSERVQPPLESSSNGSNDLAQETPIQSGDNSSKGKTENNPELPLATTSSDVSSEEGKQLWKARSSSVRMVRSSDKVSHHIDTSSEKKENIPPSNNIRPSPQENSNQRCIRHHLKIMEYVPNFILETRKKLMEPDFKLDVPFAGLIAIKFYGEGRFRHAFYAEDMDSFTNQVVELVGNKQWENEFSDLFTARLNNLSKRPNWHDIKLSLTCQIFNKTREGKCQLTEFNQLWNEEINDRSSKNGKKSSPLHPFTGERNFITANKKEDIGFFFPEELKAQKESGQSVNKLIEIINHCLKLPEVNHNLDGIRQNQGNELDGWELLQSTDQ